MANNPVKLPVAPMIIYSKNADINLGDIMFNKNQKTKQEKTNSNKEKNEKTSNEVLKKSLEYNINLFSEIFANDETLIIRRFQNKVLKSAKCCVLYFDGMVKTEIINENIIKPILSNDLSMNILEENLLEELQYKVIVSNDVKTEINISRMNDAAIYGDTIFLLEGYEKALIINTKGWQTRTITEPESEKIIRGPREGFTESIMMNISMVRRKIKSTDLKFKFKDIGVRTRTKTCICYIEGIVAPNILTELERRLDEINIDGILDSGYIQELIRDAPFSPFETVGYSEKPDVIASKILEGRIAIIVDGSPVALTVPFILAEASQSSEDYYNNYIFGSFNRLLRTISAYFAISIPAVYLSIVTYHQEMLPTPLLLSISASRQGVPLPTALSMFIMLLIFDALREAGTRMPTAIGQAVNIVGTLVLGQAAVEAKLVSAPVVIVTALTGILTLMNISLIGASILSRFFLLLAASVLGIYGFFLGSFLIILHVLSIRSFGVPYLLNISKVKNHNGQDTWIRAPWWSMTLRPKIIGAKNLVRQAAPKNRRR